MEKSYWLVRLGKGNIYAQEGYNNSFIGVNFVGNTDLTKKLYENWRDFNREMIPVWLQLNPGKSKVAAGLACGNLWTVCKGISIGDIVVTPLGNQSFAIGEIIGNYYFVSGADLPHRRAVRWFNTVSKSSMSEGLQNTIGSIMTAFSLNKYLDELTSIISHQLSLSDSLEGQWGDSTAFPMEKQLEDFLVQQWDHLELGKKYDIYEVDGEKIGQQYPSDTGPIDILAISKDKKELLVVELKRGRASDDVVGQIQRYMGYVKEELAESDQTVKGLIISFEEDIRVKRALSVAPDITQLFYQVHFTLKSKK